MTTMEMNVSCEDVRREIAASAPDAPLPPGARAHLAGCDACALALADAALAEAPTEPAAVAPPARLIDLAIPLAAADARGFGWLFAGARLGPRALALLVALAFAVVAGTGAFFQSPYIVQYSNDLWIATYADLAEGMNTVVHTPGGLPLLERMFGGASAERGLTAPDARLVQHLFLADENHDLTVDFQEVLRVHAELPAGAERGPATRFLFYVLQRSRVRDDAVLRALHRDAEPRSGRDQDELVWIGAGIQNGLFPASEVAARCERAILLRWRMVRAYGRKAKQDLILSDAWCSQHNGHAAPELAGHTTELVGSLAAGHMLHAWNASWPAVLAALTDPEWRIPNLIWAFRSTIPGLAGCAAFLALWVLALAFRRRAAIGAALAHEPDRGARPLAFLSLALSPAVAAAATAGGALWITCAYVFDVLDFPLMGERHYFPSPGFLVNLVFKVELTGLAGADKPFLALAIWLALLGALTAAHLRALRWLNPDTPLRVRDVLFPLGAVLLFALPPAPSRPSGLAQAVVLAVAMTLAMRWLRVHASVPERRFAAMTAFAAAVLVITNSGALLPPDRDLARPLLRAALALFLVVLPGVTGYALAHLPAGTWRAQRMLAAGAFMFAPLAFASLALRVGLARMLAFQSPFDWVPVAGTCAALFATAAASLVLGARLAPAGAAAFRDPSPPSRMIPRWVADVELSRTAIALWLVLGWLVGHLGVLAVHLNLI